MKDLYIHEPWVESKRIRSTDTCQRTSGLYARQYSPDNAIVQIWTAEGSQHMRFSLAHLSKAQCVQLADTLRAIAENIH